MRLFIQKFFCCGSTRKKPSKTEEEPQDQTDVDSLAREHILCTKCSDAVGRSKLLLEPSKGSEPFRTFQGLESLARSAAEGCHLCSLIFGAAEPVPTSIEDLVVTLRISRSLGISLLVEATVPDSENRRRLGELAIIPVEELEEANSGPSQQYFTFTGDGDQTRIRIHSYAQHSAQIAKSSSSAASASLAREWLRNCLKKHPKCQAAASTATGTQGPSYLLDVQETPRIVKTRKLSSPLPKFLALSHCWGGAEILRLLTKNIDAMQVGIPMSTLPKTFQDAIVITRYRYLWIDSLCIIQDSKAHWDQESKIMGAVYGRADCTIAALSAINSHEGCFVDRNPLVSLPCFLKAGGKSWYIEGNPTIGVELRDSKLQPLPLHQRAWVVQERLLSPRTLYYGSFGLAWECVECSATESIPEGAVSRFSPKMSFFAIHQLPPDGNPELNGQKIYEEWLTAQIAYTRCSLTKFTDKLVAISGVINRIESITGWTNIFGLWKERFLVDLLWFLEEPSIRPPVNVAPSWSWASIEGRVMMATGPSEEVKFMAEVEAGAMPSQKSFGLQLKARVRQVTGRRGKLNPGSPGSPAPTWDEVDWDPDVFPDEAWEMWCMLIARLPSYLGGEEVFDVGLVLTPEMGKWKRIGLWRQMHTVGNSVLFPIEDDYELTEVVVI